MTHLHFIRKTLGIKDTNITFENRITEEDIKGAKHLIYYGKLTYTPKGCQNCGVKNSSHADIVKNGTKASTIKLTQIGFKPVLLKLKKQRFLCKHCSSTFIAKTNLVNRHCFISNHIKAAISMELREEQSMTLIAKHMNVSTSTVIRQLIQVGEGLRPKYNSLPEHLCIDEFKSVKNVSGAMSFLFLDAVTHKLMDIVENRQRHYLFDYFMRYSLKARRQVKTVTMDMYSPYISLVEACFPNAEIIIDRFHIVQHLNRALNQVRIQTMKKIRNTSPTDYRKLKKLWKMILIDEMDLNHTDYFTHRLFGGMVTEYIMVQYLVALSPELLATYILVNRLKWALKNRDFERFTGILVESKKQRYPRKVRTVLQTLERYIEPISNAFTYSLSNGPIEGVNNKIKNIKRSGYGYRNFEHLRYRALISFTLTKNNRKPKALYFKKQTGKVS